MVIEAMGYIVCISGAYINSGSTVKPIGRLSVAIKECIVTRRSYTSWIKRPLTTLITRSNSVNLFFQFNDVFFNNIKTIILLNVLEIDFISQTLDSVNAEAGDVGEPLSIADFDVATGENPPASPSVGTLWYDTVNLALMVYIDDGNSLQWVQAN